MLVAGIARRHVAKQLRIQQTQIVYIGAGRIRNKVQIASCALDTTMRFHPAGKS